MAKEEEKAEQVVVTVEEEEEREIWVKHYHSSHQILLVGEGDFSFSLSLALSFGSASNILASSLDSYDMLIKMYKQVKSNLEKLELLGASILHGVDATKMKLHTDLRMRQFDRIIFNFPHAGFHGKEDTKHLIKLHRNLVHEFFKNASGMLRTDGEIHVNHKTTAPFSHWNLEELASQSSLALIECVDFKIEDYPGYNNKRGAGLRCDKPFPLGECSTFKFRFSPSTKRMPKVQSNLDIALFQHLQVTQTQTLQQPFSFEIRMPQTNFTGYVGESPRYRQETSIRTLQHTVSFESRLPQTNFTAYTNENPGYAESPRTVGITNECSRIFHGYLNRNMETFGRADCDVHYFVQETLKLAFQNYMEVPGRGFNGYLTLLQELHQLSVMRSAWLRKMLLDLDHPG